MSNSTGNTDLKTTFKKKKMNPENVNPNNFSVIHVLFNNDDFSIAYGTWEDNINYLAMRWNGNQGDAGYPKVFGHPMWFIVDNELCIPFLQSLVGNNNADNEKLLMVLEELT